MNKFTVILFICIISLFAGNSKTVYLGILQPDGVSEYDAGTIGYVTFQAWLEQGAGAAISAPTLDHNGRPTAPYTQVIQIGDYLAEAKMLSYRGAVSFNMQEFDTWGIDNVLNVVIKDESRILEGYWENSYSWIIDDTSTGTYAYGMEPLMPGTGAPMGITTWRVSIELELPNSTELEQNYPNPFNPTTAISFSIVNTGDVSLNVYNFSGQLVESLVEGQMSAGYHTVNFDASNLSAGIYYYTLEADNKVITNKMVLVK